MVISKATVVMENWNIPLTPRVKLGYSGENDVCLFEVITEPQEGFTYYLELQPLIEEANNILLTPDYVEGSVYVELTTEMLGSGGIKKAQIVAYIDTEDAPIKKSNVFEVEVDASINATKSVESHYQTALSQWSKILASFNPQEVLAKLQEVEAEVNTAEEGITYITNLACRLYKFPGAPLPQSNPELYPGIRTGDLTFASGDLYFAQGVTELAITWKKLSGSGSGGTDDYNDLDNKPQINSVELSGNKTLANLGIQAELTAKNGIDIDNNEISVDIDDIANTRTDSGNVLRKEVDGKIAVYTSVIVNDTVFQNTMPFYPAIRQGLTNPLTSDPLASKSYVDGLLSGAVKRQVVQTLPVSDIDENTIYMLPKTTAETNNIYDEYMYINNAWELIGTTEVDLTDYYTKTEVNTALSNKQNTINASNKLNADNLSDGTTSKPSYWNKAPKMYKGNGQPSTTASSYTGVNEGDFYLDTLTIGNGNMHLYQCTFNYMDSLIWRPVAYTDNIKQLPDSIVSDEGKFLRVNASGQAEWQTDTAITTNTTDTTASLTLANNNEYRFTQELSSITLTLPQAPANNFISGLVFESGATPTAMTYDSSIKWSGDDVTSNAFVPVASKTYNIVFWFDGININAVARGV